jgi:hypothetical protein
MWGTKTEILNRDKHLFYREGFELVEVDDKGKKKINDIKESEFDNCGDIEAACKILKGTNDDNN